MKLCLSCQTSFENADWSCPNCGARPEWHNGFACFAPQFAESNAGAPEGVHHYFDSLQEGSFWFRGRRRIIQALATRYCPNARTFLEVGCGTGFVLAGLRVVLPEAKLVASELKVAEAAKVIENSQRDLNIAFMNELSIIFHLLDINTADVLAAAATKWNFLNFTPGLVGGHCIGVDPYYLTERAQKAGYHPDVILAGRRINDTMGVRVARECVRRLLKSGARAERVTVLGLTFKENVVDRNSQVVDLIRELQSFGMIVQVHDPLADATTAMQEYGLRLLKEQELAPADALVLAVGHDSYRAAGWPLISRLLKNSRGLVMDVKGALDPRKRPQEIDLWRL